MLTCFPGKFGRPVCTCFIGLSHLPRFDHDCNRGHHREGIGIIVTDLIRSYLILMSIVAIGLIVIKFLTAKNFSTIIPIDKSIAFIASDRNTSYQIATDRIYSCTSIAAIATNRGQGERHDVIRSPTICCDLSRCIDRDLIRLVHEQIRYSTIRYG